MSDPYEQFVADRIAAGDTSDEIREGLESQLIYPGEPRCFHCGRKATLLCDYIIGVRGGMGSYSNGIKAMAFDTDDPETFTCDRPLCECCAAKGSPTFLCGKAGGVEVPDFCRDHAAGQAYDFEPMTDEEAGRRRRLLHTHCAPAPPEVAVP